MRKNSNEQSSRTIGNRYPKLTQNMAPAFLLLFSLSACNSGNDDYAELIAESDWASEENLDVNQQTDSMNSATEGTGSTSVDETDNATLNPNNVTPGGSAQTEAPDNNNSSESPSTTSEPDNNNSTANTSATSGSENNNSSGSASTATESNNNNSSTDSTSTNTSESTESESNNSSGNTTTETESNNNNPTGGSTSEPDTGAAKSSNSLPFIDFKAPAVNLPSSKPALRKETKISAAGTVVKRISDFSEFASGKLPHFNASDDTQLNHAYPRHHAFSKDNTYILGNSGWRWRALWRADGTFVREITQAGSGHAVWANTENDYIYIVDIDSQRSFAKTNVLTDERRVLRTFPYPITIGKTEGDISDDDKRIAFSSDDNGKVRVTAYDIENDSYTERTLNRSYSELDWVSVSRSGKYILVAYHKGKRDVELYNWDLSFVRRITNQKHGDIGWDENGDECWFSIGHLEPSLSRTTIGKWRLSDNAYTEVLGGPGRFENRPDSLSGHISARASDRVPGVIHVSLLDREGPYTLFSLKTDGSEKIQFFGWHGSATSNYYDEPHLATNRTGDVGIFKSNWGNADDPTEMYLIYKDPDS